MQIKQVFGARVVIRRVEAEAKTSSGIFLPEKVAEENRARQGAVLLVGDGMWGMNGEKIPMTVKAGDQVIYKEFSGVEVKDGEDTLVIINEGDILAVIES